MTGPASKPLDIILFGLGALGSLVVDCLRTGYPLIRVVGAVDNAAGKPGRNLAELYPGLAHAETVTVRATLGETLADLDRPADLVLHMTESVLAHIEDQLIACLSARLHVISASEAMFDPWLRFAAVAGRLDACARDHGVSITGVGINPGFSFDSFPLLLGRVTSGVTKVIITRCIDVTGTGPADIDHVGYALWPHEFDAGIASGRIVGHMGCPESIAAIAERLGLEIDRIEEGWSTETAAFPVDSGTSLLGMIAPGRVIGITQTGRGMRGPETVVSTSLAMYYEPERFGLEPADTVELQGAHHVRASIRPAALSLFGAANTIVNAIHDVAAATPGLINVLDLSVAGTRRGGFRYVLDPQATPGPKVTHLKRIQA